MSDKYATDVRLDSLIRRIVDAINYHGNSDNEDLPSIIGPLLTDLTAANAKLEAVRIALGGYPDSDLASLAITLKARCTALEGIEAERDEWRDKYAASVSLHQVECPSDPCPCLDDYKDDDNACARCCDLEADQLLAAAREAVKKEVDDDLA